LSTWGACSHRSNTLCNKLVGQRCELKPFHLVRMLLHRQSYRTAPYLTMTSILAPLSTSSFK
jgi:hypothetical protein